jgi:hypothetical protein
MLLYQKGEYCGHLGFGELNSMPKELVAHALIGHMVWISSLAGWYAKRPWHCETVLYAVSQHTGETALPADRPDGRPAQWLVFWASTSPGQRE